MWTAQLKSAKVDAFDHDIVLSCVLLTILQVMSLVRATCVLMLIPDRAANTLQAVAEPQIYDDLFTNELTPAIERDLHSSCQARASPSTKIKESQAGLHTDGLKGMDLLTQIPARSITIS